MTRSLWLVALESKAGRHVYNGESMHLSVLLRSKIWCSPRIPIAPSLMALLPLKVDAVSLCWTSLRDSRENDREGWTCHEKRRELLMMGWPHLFAIEASDSIFVIMWVHWINVCTMKLCLFDNHQRSKTITGTLLHQIYP